ncbi:PREDICTED: beta-glucosidase 12-like isoform X1 [Nelumbo nucifera]|uniref:Beta-glucosidase 12-like isoform X1 n=1 Tax=Nelumbo nucifera TaxID=4432 RepID=A0A1U8AE71_NELNU|nr:PREDICTED: beta-glucosidase 12-like isoform X1 [Nelumbo nucifera]
MAFQSFPLLGLLILVDLLGRSGGAALSNDSSTSLNRYSFPAGFVFGAASASYQFEGAAKQGGKGPSIWDTFTHKYPGKIADRSNGDVAIDFYHRYKGDVGIMKEMGLDAFRFSISWPRILPHGKLSGGVNREGIRFYNNLIDELLSHGLQPYVTLFHWDLPQALEDEYGGFLNTKIVDDFRDYAEICFREFGDRVKSWITFNEPWTFSNGGYSMDTLAPGRCSPWVSLSCTGGNSGTEPYLVAHNQLLAHAAAVKAYKDKYQASQEGKIGITLVSHWFVPYSNDKASIQAAQRAIDFMFGWLLHPLTYGDYPESMRSLVGKRLPKLTPEQSMAVKGSFDFLGLNYYTANYAANVLSFNSVNISYNTDSHVNLSTTRKGALIGKQAGSSWLFVYPRGIHDLLLYVKKQYKDPVIYITENGVSEKDDSSLTLKEALVDNLRIEYYQSHLSFVQKAIKKGVNVKGYFARSLMDNFEWSDGYSVRFGINYIDYKNGLKRYPKHSAYWFKKFLQR